MNQLKAAFILLVCSSIYSVFADEGCSEDGYFVVEEDCSRYYRCAAGTKYDFDCNDGLKFNSKLQVCVWADQIDCVSVPRPVKEPEEPTEKKPSPPTADCPNGDGYFVDEENCARFYVCSDGERKFSSCDNDLYFDTVSHTCSPKETAKCTN